VPTAASLEREFPHQTSFIVYHKPLEYIYKVPSVISLKMVWGETVHAKSVPVGPVLPPSRVLGLVG
jgi:hypothetical protein